MKIYERVAFEREQLHLSQAYVANAVKMPLHMYKLLESGCGEFTPVEIAKLNNIFLCDVREPQYKEKDEKIWGKGFAKLFGYDG